MIIELTKSEVLYIRKALEFYADYERRRSEHYMKLLEQSGFFDDGNV